MATPMAFADIVTDVTSLITTAGIWPFVVAGVIFALAGGMVKLAKRAGK